MIETVRGPLPAAEWGPALTHEHVLCDFAGADATSPDRWDGDEVFEAMLPRMQAVRAQGITGFVDCTPEWIGRDVHLLRRLADAADMHIVTNTGWYGAAGDKFLPASIATLTATDLADHWTREAEHGIDGIKPGFIKIGVDPGPLSATDRTLVEAAAITHLRTGLVVGSHTANGVAGVAQVDLLMSLGVRPDAFICIHTDAESDPAQRAAIAASGCWVSYDGIGARPLVEHVALIAEAPSDRLLLSQDTGWWWAGEPNGGRFRPWTTLAGEFLPLAGLTPHAITVNPARAFDRR